LQFSSVYFLVFHGSRDPRSQQAAKQLTEAFRQRIRQTSQFFQVVERGFAGASDRLPEPLLPFPEQPPGQKVNDASAPTVWVEDVYLECVTLPLHQQIQQFIEQWPGEPQSVFDWRIIPVFLLPGTHVMQDIPTEIELLQAKWDPLLPLTVTAHLGSVPGLRRVLNERLSLHPMEAWILVAHGSRRAGANQIVEQLADQVGAVTAYWATSPSLAERVAELNDAGLRRIGILPYFLFSGGITDAIAQTVSQLSQQWPHLNLMLTEPLAMNEAKLADLLVNLATAAAIAPMSL
jgi:sirohydrochlorin ferrochelatase